MILEEATKEAFGYYPSALTHGSNAPVIAACEVCGKFKITTRYSYRTFCGACSFILGEKQKGVSHYNFGKHHTEEQGVIEE